MTNDENKALHERATFMRFVELTRQQDLWGSVENRPHQNHEPDLLCKHKDEGYVAFELVRVCDPEVAKLHADPDKHDHAERTPVYSPVEIVRKKLRNLYLTKDEGIPMELLIYSEGQVNLPEDALIAEIVPLLRIKNHKFRRVWFMGVSYVWCLLAPN